MGRYAEIKKEFDFLETNYGFAKYMKQKHGSYYFIIWSNSSTKIMTLYDDTDQQPMLIRVYDADSLGFDAVEYKDELICDSKSPKEKIRYAGAWLKKAIENKAIVVN